MLYRAKLSNGELLCEKSWARSDDPIKARGLNPAIKSLRDWKRALIQNCTQEVDIGAPQLSGATAGQNGLDRPVESMLVIPNTP